MSESQRFLVRYLEKTEKCSDRGAKKFSKFIGVQK